MFCDSENTEAQQASSASRRPLPLASANERIHLLRACRWSGLGRASIRDVVGVVITGRSPAAEGRVFVNPGDVLLFHGSSFARAGLVMPHALDSWPLPAD